MDDERTMNGAAVDVSLHKVSSSEHLVDLELLRQRGLDIAHHHKLVATGLDGFWCRVSQCGELLSGFVVLQANSRALPGTRILRVERFGRELHSPLLPHIASVVRQVIGMTGRVLRLSIEIFDDHQTRRTLFSKALVNAGMNEVVPHSYTETLQLTWQKTAPSPHATFSSTVNRKCRELRKNGVRIARIEDCRLAPAMLALHLETFKRTGGTRPPIDFSVCLAHANRFGDSVFWGAFNGTEDSPESLIAFAWVRGHGDHASYDAAASRRDPDLGKLAAGYGVMVACIDWSFSQGLDWFDFGGVLPTGASSTDPRYGINEFKLRFCQERLTVAQEYSIEPIAFLRAMNSGVQKLKPHIAG